MKLAYADPVYLGKRSATRSTRNRTSSTTWRRTAELLARLDAEYDGWAYSLNSTTLGIILPMAPPCRIAAWVKPFAAFKRNVRIAYTWEPVLFKPARDSSELGAPVGRDHLAESITLRRGLTGAKPERFCQWVLDLLGYIEGDTVDDLFPGTGVMGRVLAKEGTL